MLFIRLLSVDHVLSKVSDATSVLDLCGDTVVEKTSVDLLCDVTGGGLPGHTVLDGAIRESDLNWLFWHFGNALLLLCIDLVKQGDTLGKE
jgi:hypothetical protein